MRIIEKFEAGRRIKKIVNKNARETEDVWAVRKSMKRTQDEGE